MAVVTSTTAMRAIPLQSCLPAHSIWIIARGARHEVAPLCLENRRSTVWARLDDALLHHLSIRLVSGVVCLKPLSELFASEARVLFNVATDTDPFLAAWTVDDSLSKRHVLRSPILIYNLTILAIRRWTLPQAQSTLVCFLQVDLLDCGQPSSHLNSKHAAHQPAGHNTGVCRWT